MSSFVEFYLLTSVSVFLGPPVPKTYQCTCMLGCIQLFATPWTVAHQASLSVGFFRQEYWSGLHFLLQGVIGPTSSALQVDSLPSEPLGKRGGTTDSEMCKGIF